MDFMPERSSKKKLIEKVLQTSAKARKEKENNPSVINATIGSFYDETGNIQVFSGVRECFEHPNYNNFLSYSNVKGNHTYNEYVKEWVLGDYYEDDYIGYHINAVTTPGGTGAINLCLGSYFEPDDTILLPSIMWPVYIQICQNLALKHEEYELYNEAGLLNIVDIKDKLIKVAKAKGKVGLIINDPCHNPTGYCLSKQDYLDLVEAINEASNYGKVILLMDIAYLDFSKDLGNVTRNNFKELMNLSANCLLFFAFSASKTFSIYGLRLGALLQVTKDDYQAELFENSCVFYARSTWSNVSQFGQRIVENCLSDKAHRDKFIEELNTANNQLHERYEIFKAIIEKANVPYATHVDGFFVLLYIKDPAFQAALESYGAYGVKFGEYYRLSLASITKDEASRLAEYVVKAYQSIK